MGRVGIRDLGLSLCLLLAVFAMGNGNTDRVLRVLTCLLAVLVATVGLGRLVRGAPPSGDGARVRGKASRWVPGIYLLWIGVSVLALETALLLSKVPLAVYQGTLAGIVGIGAVLVVLWAAITLVPRR